MTVYCGIYFTHADGFIVTGSQFAIIGMYLL